MDAAWSRKSSNGKLYFTGTGLDVGRGLACFQPILFLQKPFPGPSNSPATPALVLPTLKSSRALGDAIHSASQYRADQPVDQGYGDGQDAVRHEPHFDHILYIEFAGGKGNRRRRSTPGEHDAVGTVR